MGNRTVYLNWLIIIPTIILISLGLATLLSIDQSAFWQQLFFVVFGIGLFWITSRLNFSVFQYLDKFLLGFCIIFLLVSYLGPNIRGATRWISIGTFNLQPSEFVKPIFLLAISSLLVRYPPTKLKHVLMHSGIFLTIFIIILRQPDLGSALVYVSMWCVLIILAGLPLRYIMVALALFLLALPVSYGVLHDYQKLRIVTFLNPGSDPRGAGYNAIQSMISVGSGKLVGRGFGRGTQSLLEFLPERHTDFIFASFAEEFGFIGGALLLFVFFILLIQLLKQAKVKDPASIEFLFTVGFFTMLLTHIIINVGMNMGIVPITGITLPFVSYGGSSLLATLMGLGLVMAASQEQKQY